MLSRPSSASEPLPVAGRVPGGSPVAVIDIGSNSVRLVVYERLARSPTPLFNEKILAGLGSGVAQSGKLSTDAAESTRVALRRGDPAPRYFHLISHRFSPIEIGA